MIQTTKHGPPHVDCISFWCVVNWFHRKGNKLTKIVIDILVVFYLFLMTTLIVHFLDLPHGTSHGRRRKIELYPNLGNVLTNGQSYLVHQIII